MAGVVHGKAVQQYQILVFPSSPDVEPAAALLARLHPGKQLQHFLDIRFSKKHWQTFYLSDFNVMLAHLYVVHGPGRMRNDLYVLKAKHARYQGDIQCRVLPQDYVKLLRFVAHVRDDKPYLPGGCGKAVEAVLVGRGPPLELQEIQPHVGNALAAGFVLYITADRMLLCVGPATREKSQEQ